MSRLEEWIRQAENEVTLLHADPKQAEVLLSYYPIPASSLVGEMAGVGGLLVDRGWLRLLGSGHEGIRGHLMSWNDGNAPYFIVGYDVVGGFFAVDGARGNVLHWAPDTLAWEDTEKDYGNFMLWALNGDLDLYYSTMRWSHWEKDVRRLQGHEGFLIQSFLWSAEGQDMEKNVKKPVSITELWQLQQDIAQQLNEKR
jgi:hypothetical protein